MKSLRDEIRLAAGDKDGFNFIQATGLDFICIADFAAKLQIALKECYETEYWLELMQKAELLPEETVKGYLHDCGSIRRMLIASVNTTKEKAK